MLKRKLLALVTAAAAVISFVNCPGLKNAVNTNGYAVGTSGETPAITTVPITTSGTIGESEDLYPGVVTTTDIEDAPVETTPEEEDAPIETSAPIVTSVPVVTGGPSGTTGVTGAPAATTTAASTDTTLPPEGTVDGETNTDEDTVYAENIEEAIEAAANAAEGTTIVVTVPEDGKISADLLEAVKGMDVELVLDMGNGFVWTINGLDIEDASDINLTVSFGAENIPDETIEALCGEKTYVTLKLAHEGSFGFTATLTVELGEEYKNLFANLYHFDEEAGEAKYEGNDKINKNGKADLEFAHASEYIIVIDEESHGKTVVEADDENSEDEDDDDTSVDTEDEAATETDDNPGTGVALGFSGVLFSAATVALLRKKKN